MSLFALTDNEALEFADGHATPCFVYRLDAAEERFRALSAVLPDRVRLAYAVKANPHPGIVARFAALGSDFDVASIGELELLRRAGVPGGRILFAGPGKSTEELELALSMGVRIEIDGLEDAERIEGYLSAAAPAGRPASPLALSVRVHPADGISESSRIIGGAGPSAFGVDEEDLPRFLQGMRSFRHIAVTGLQVFAASNERDASRLIANHRVALSIAERMAKDAKLDLELIDLGGGLGIPYAEGEAELDIEALGKGLDLLLRENSWFGGKLLVEPGRWLVGPCGAYLSRVIRVKESRGTRFAVLEGGINHLLRPLLTGQPFPVRAPGRDGEAKNPARAGRERTCTLTGPLCTSLDRLCSVVLPPLGPGDLLVFGQTGAYGYTEAMGAFLSHPLPAEHCLDH